MQKMDCHDDIVFISFYCGLEFHRSPEINFRLFCRFRGLDKISETEIGELIRNIGIIVFQNCIARTTPFLDSNYLNTASEIKMFYSNLHIYSKFWKYIFF